MLLLRCIIRDRAALAAAVLAFAISPLLFLFVHDEIFFQMVFCCVVCFGSCSAIMSFDTRGTYLRAMAILERGDRGADRLANIRVNFYCNRIGCDMAIEEARQKGWIKD